MPPTAGGPQRLSLPRTPLLGLPHTQDRSAEGQPPLGRTHSPPQAEGDEAPPPNPTSPELGGSNHQAPAPTARAGFLPRGRSVVMRARAAAARRESEGNACQGFERP